MGASGMGQYHGRESFDMGASGMGQYHGRESFDTFSHKKSIVNKATWLDVPFRYAPYANWKHKFVRMFVH